MGHKHEEFGDMPEKQSEVRPRLPTHPLARRTLSILHDVRRRARATTPTLLLAEAVERLAVRPILAAREGDGSPRVCQRRRFYRTCAALWGMRTEEVRPRSPQRMARRRVPQ